jgi:hypothetical protein
MITLLVPLRGASHYQVTVGSSFLRGASGVFYVTRPRVSWRRDDHDRWIGVAAGVDRERTPADDARAC